MQKCAWDIFKSAGDAKQVCSVDMEALKNVHGLSEWVRVWRWIIKGIQCFYVSNVRSSKWKGKAF